MFAPVLSSPLRGRARASDHSGIPRRAAYAVYKGAETRRGRRGRFHEEPDGISVRRQFRTHHWTTTGRSSGAGMLAAFEGINAELAMMMSGEAEGWESSESASAKPAGGSGTAPTAGSSGVKSAPEQTAQGRYGVDEVL